MMMRHLIRISNVFRNFQRINLAQNSTCTTRANFSGSSIYKSDVDKSVKVSPSHLTDHYTIDDYIRKLKNGEISDYTDDDWMAGYLVYDQASDGNSWKNLGFDGEKFKVIEWGSHTNPNGFEVRDIDTKEVEKKFQHWELKFIVRNHFKLKADEAALDAKFPNREDILKDPEGLEKIVGKSRAAYLIGSMQEAQEREKKLKSIKKSSEKNKDWGD